MRRENRIVIEVELCESYIYKAAPFSHTLPLSFSLSLALSHLLSIPTSLSLPKLALPMLMASSVIGVSSIFHTPSIELSTRRPNSATPTLSSSSFSLPSSEKTHFNSLVASGGGGGGGGGGRPPLVLQSSAHYKHGLSFVPSAIATPNSILSEEAFKGLSGGLSDFDDDDDVESRDYESENETAGGESLSDEDELAISKLGLPQKLVDTLEKRGITHLFPIQVSSSISWLISFIY